MKTTARVRGGGRRMVQGVECDSFIETTPYSAN